MCYSPLFRLKDEFVSIGSARFPNVFGRYGTRQVIGRESFDFIKSQGFNEDYLQRIPCSNCIECRLNYSKSWAVRCVCESRLYPDNTCWFVTFTYDDLHLPTPISILSRETGRISDFYPLLKSDMQNYLKRLRKLFPGLRYYLCGEYGSKNFRPHYHMILFNVPLVGLVVNPDFTKSRISEVDCHELYESSELNSCWTDSDGKLKGLVAVAKFSYDTACYTARYCMKKLKGVDAKEFDKKYVCFDSEGVIIPFPKEYVSMSLKPGIGADYFVKHFGQIYSSDDLVLYFNKQVNHVRPPRYSDILYERVTGNSLDSFKQIREEVAKNQYILQLAACGMSDVRYNLMKRDRRLHQSKRLIRSL